MKFFPKAVSALFISVFFFVVGCVGSDSQKSYAGMGELKDAQLFTLPDLSGESVALADLLKTRKAVLVNFWATWCPPCREEIPGLISLQARLGGESFTILGVDIGESEKKVSSYVAKTGINYPMVLDKSQSVAESYRIVGIPTTLLINSEGKILGEYHAYTPELVRDVEKAIK